MSFPGTYNISYYYGDTLEFNVYPKNASGDVFDGLETFQTSRFTIAPTRGADIENQIFAYAQVSPENTHIVCAIRPEDALKMSPSTSYVYDIEIAKTSAQSSTPYDIVYTLLTGTLTITQDVTKPGSAPVPELPGGATALTLDSSTPSVLNVSWTAPTTGGTPSAYRYAILPFTSDQATLRSALQDSLTTTVSTSAIFFGLEENIGYSVVILPTNSAGDSILDNLITNTTPFTTTDNPLTVEPDFVVTNDGSSAYLIDGVAGDNITLVRGENYIFEINASGHPFRIQTSPAPYDSADEYTTGVTVTSGTRDLGVITWQVAQNAPATLFYVCEVHEAMDGTITIIDGES